MRLARLLIGDGKSPENPLGLCLFSDGFLSVVTVVVNFTTAERQADSAVASGCRDNCGSKKYRSEDA